MKKIGADLSLLGLLSQATALAWVGGPYSNNTYDGFAGGIFTGTIRGSNTSGILKFSQGNEAYVSPFGDSIVYNKGMAYYGECYGFVDFDSKTVSGVTNGSNSGANLNDPNSSPQYRNLFGNGFGVQNGVTVGGYQTGQGGSIGAAGSNVGSANSSWNGKITKSKQTMRFRAKGEMTLFGSATEVTEFNNVTSTGDFQNPRFDGGIPGKDAIPASPGPPPGVAGPAVPAIPGTGLNLIGTGNPPGTGSTIRVSGAANNYPNIESVIKIKVYGSRTSVRPAFTPTGYAG